MSLLHPSAAKAPHIDGLTPRAAIPGGTLMLTGSHMFSTHSTSSLPYATLGESMASLDMVRERKVIVRVPEGAISSDLTLHTGGHASNVVHANIGVPMADGLHIVSNPAVDADGNLFVMVSGPRGESVPVSIFRIDRDLQIRPFVRDMMNVSALAFDRAGYLYASSRSEGTVYRITPEGAVTTFAEGMGIATGLAFDAAGNLFVGDRSGTIFKISPDKEIFVFATLEPSVAAYHLAFRDDGTLLVTAPTTSSHQCIFAIDAAGNTTEFYRGLGRPQGMAFDVDGNLYVAASLEGRRGIVRITPDRVADLLVSGNDLVGLCFLEDGCAALATNSTLFHIGLDIEGRAL